jgi:ferritin-like metal-binding protein YciE
MNSKDQSDTDLHDLLVDQLRDILWAEKHLVKALPKMAKAANDTKLSEAFTSHLAETKVHVTRLEEILKSLGLSPRAKKCPAMEGLLKEGDELAEEYADSTALDAALITAAQKVEHYEIATYGTIRAFAKRLGYADAVKLLTATLDEEGKADHTLTEIATGGVNQMAVA